MKLCPIPSGDVRATEVITPLQNAAVSQESSCSNRKGRSSISGS